MLVSQVRRDLRNVASRARAKSSRSFFKTGAGEYGEGDRFLGVTVPAVRAIALKYRDLPPAPVLRLLKSPWHEERLLALLILTGQYPRADRRRRAEIYKHYLRHTRWINNWDLVDASASAIVGAHLQDRSRDALRRLARSKWLWDRRIAIIATFHYIKQEQFAEAIDVATLLQRDRHDLIHKAVGWMLREIGKRDRGVEERFLREHAAAMPRTMLRYAIERFPERRRRQYLSMKRT